MIRQDLLKVAKPILFNTEMVQAILDNRKSVTRRVIKAPVLLNHDKPDKITLKKDTCKFNWNNTQVIGGFELKLPYKIGYYLYVRETWGIGGFDCEYSEMFVQYKADGATAKIALPKEKFEKYYNSISGSESDFRPSIFMPKEAARIFLKVTDVRVERLQDINGQGHHDDILKEGLKNNCRGQRCASYGKCSYQMTNLTYCFSELWDSTIKKQDLDKYGWEANPWVWVIEFERVEVENE